MESILDNFFKTQKFILLDGAMATELERLGANLNHPLWSTKALLDSPELIRKVHLNYLEAGADIITTSSYQASFQGLKNHGVGERVATRLFQLSTQLAVEARESFLKNHNPLNRVLIAASIGPYGAYLANGAEYSGDYGLTVKELKQFHRKRLEVLSGSEADLLLFETIPSLSEALALIELLVEISTLPAMMSFSCRNGTSISDGTKFSEAVAIAEKSSQVLAIGVNCTSPTFIEQLLKEAGSATEKPLLAYPNSGEKWDAQSKNWQLESMEKPVFFDAEKWVAAGAKIIGGCCRTSPIQTKEMEKLKWKI